MPKVVKAILTLKPPRFLTKLTQNQTVKRKYTRQNRLNNEKGYADLYIATRIMTPQPISQS